MQHCTASHKPQLLSVGLHKEVQPWVPALGRVCWEGENQRVGKKDRS